VPNQAEAPMGEQVDKGLCSGSSSFEKIGQATLVRER
jgi:hypothetical protein